MLYELLIVLALVVTNGLFAGAEIAVLTLRKTRLTQLVEAGGSAAGSIRALRNRPERFLATVQIGITVIGATSAAYGGSSIANDIAASLLRAGLSGRAAEEIALAVVVAGISYLSLVLGELVPKSLALRYAERYALLVARPLRALSSMMRPLVWLLTASSNAILRLFGDRTTFTETRLSREELQEMVEEAARAGSLDPGSSEIASRAIGFGDLRVGEVMVPRAEIVALPKQAATAEVRRLLLEEGRSRMPVYDGSLDNIVGYVIARDVLAWVLEGQLVLLEDILRPVHVVPTIAPALDVLKVLQRRRTQIAIVVDEHGAVVGLVTVEDLVEELVGDIFSEHEPERFRRQPDGSALVMGTTTIRDTNRELGTSLPEGTQWTSVAGLVIAKMGWIPPVGATITLDDGTTLEVVEGTSRRVTTVRVRPGGAAPKSP